MKTRQFSIALLRTTVRRHGLNWLAMLLVIELIHYFRHGSLALSDAGDAMIALLVFATISLLIEYNRMVNGKQDAPKG